MRSGESSILWQKTSQLLSAATHRSRGLWVSPPRYQLPISSGQCFQVDSLLPRTWQLVVTNPPKCGLPPSRTWRKISLDMDVFHLSSSNLHLGEIVHGWTMDNKGHK